MFGILISRHFDITQYCARKLQGRLNGHAVGEGATQQDACNEANQKYNEILQEFQDHEQSMQQRYDDETAHATDPDAQQLWCDYLWFLFNPPPPPIIGDKISARASGTITYMPGSDTIMFSPFIITGLELDDDLNFIDSYLLNQPILIPPLFHVNDLMDMVPNLEPPDPDAPMPLVVSGLGGADALQATARNLRPWQLDELQMTAWMELQQIDPVSYDQSVFLQALDGYTNAGGQVLVLSLQIPQALEAATAGWTMPANIPANLRLGTVLDCPADLDGSSSVDVADLLALLSAWGPCGPCPEDLDQSGTVDIVDLLQLLASWGACQ